MIASPGGKLSDELSPNWRSRRLSELAHVSRSSPLVHLSSRLSPLSSMIESGWKISIQIETITTRTLSDIDSIQTSDLSNVYSHDTIKRKSSLTSIIRSTWKKKSQEHNLTGYIKKRTTKKVADSSICKFNLSQLSKYGSQRYTLSDISCNIRTSGR